MSTLQIFRRHRKPLGGALAALMAVWQIGQPLQAATWDRTALGSYNWNDNANWSTPALFPNGIGAVANLNNGILGAQTVNLNQVITLGTLNIGDTTSTNAFTLAAGTAPGYLLMDVASGNAAITKTGDGLDTISTGIQFNDTLAITNSATLGTLTLSGALRSLTSDISFNGTGAVAAGSTVVSGAISTAGNLVKNNAGITRLTGGNLYAGTTTINGGTLQLVNAAALPARSAVTVAAGATLDYLNANTAIGSLSGAGTVTASTATTARTLTIGRDETSTTFNGQFFGPAGQKARLAITKIGAGTLTLAPLTGASATAAGDYTGATVINGGAVALDFSQGFTGTSMLAATPVTIAGGNLQVKGRNSGSAIAQTAGALTIGAGGGSIIMDPNGSAIGTQLTFNAATVSTAAGGSLLINSPANTTVRLGTAMNTATTINGRIVFTGDGGATYDWAANTAATTNTIGLATYTDVAGGTPTGTDTVNSRIATATVSQTTTPAGNWTTNSLRINAGATGQSLSLGANNLTLTNGGLLFTGANDYTISSTTGTLASNTATASDLVIHNYGAGNLTVGAIIANGVGASTLTTAGTGKVTLTGANTFTGAIIVGGTSTLSFNNATASGTGTLGLGIATAVTIRDGATLEYTGGNATMAASTTANSHTFLLQGGNANVRVTEAATELTLSGVISGAGGYTKTGPGTLIIGASSTFTGPLFINAGTVRSAPNVQVSSSTSPVTIGGSGTLDINDNTDNRTTTIGSLSGSGTVLNSGANAKTFSVGGDNTSTTFTGVFGAGTTAGNALTKVGSGVFTLTPSVANAWTGAKNINGGVLRFGVDQALNSSGSVLIGNGAGPSQLDLNGFDYNAATGSNQSVGFGGTGATTTTQGSILLPAGSTLTLGGALNYTATNNPMGALITSTGGNVVLSGTRTITVGDSTTVPATAAELTIDAPISGATFGITKAGFGNLMLSGNTNSYTGTTTLNAGSVILDYTTQNNAKLGTGQLALLGGGLVLNGSSAANTSETITGNTTFAAGGAASITMNEGAGRDLALNLGTLTRAAGAGTVRFNLSTDAQTGTNGILTSTANDATTGLLGTGGAWATVTDATGTNFATRSVSNIVAISPTAVPTITSWVAGQNVTDSTVYTGTLDAESAINSLRFNSAAGASTVAITPGGLLRIASGGVLQTSNVTAGISTISGGRLESSSGSELVFTTDSATQRLDVSSTVTGGSLITKTGDGTLRLSGNNTVTGAVSLQGGTLEVTGGSALGDTAALNITAVGGKAVTLSLLAGQNETIGSLGGGGTASTTSTVAIGIGSNLTINSTGNTTYSGFFTSGDSTSTLIKTGASTLTLDTVDHAFAGNLVINQGQITLGNRQRANFNTVGTVTLNSAAALLVLDFTGGTEGPSKIRDAALVTLVNVSGASGLRANSDSTTGSKTETLGATTLLGGANTITADHSSTGVTGTQRNMTIAMGALTRSNQSTLLVHGRNLGTLGPIATGHTGRITTTSTGLTVGGGGAAATTTISIVPWAVADGTAAGLGSSFAAYGTNGFRPLDTGTEYEQLVAGGGLTLDNNVRLASAASLTLSAGTHTLNSLLVDNTAATGITLAGAGAGDALNIRSGAMLFLGSNATPAGIVVNGFGNGITVSGAGTPDEFVAHVVNTAAAGVDIQSDFINGTATKFTKSGAGLLILSGTGSTYTGVTTVNQGILQIGGVTNLGNDGSGGLLLNGGTIRFGAAFDLSAIPVSLGVTATGTVVTTAGGTFDTNSNNVSFANAIGGGLNGGLTKAGLGSLTLNVAAGFSGATTINDGRLILDGGAGRLSTTAGLTLAGTSSLQLGGTTSAANQTVTELVGAAGNLIVGGNATLSTLTVNQDTATTYAGFIGGAGTNGNNIALVKTGSGILTLGAVASTFTGGLTIKAGTVVGGNNSNTFGANTNIITIGDTSGSADATLTFFNAASGYANPIEVASGSTGSATIFLGLTTGAPVLSGGINLNKDLILSKLGTTGASQVTGGITGTGNLLISNNATTGTISLNTVIVNHTGSITNSGLATGTTTIGADIGSNVTNIIQTSATSNMTLSGANIDYTGATTVSAGTLNITGDATGGTKARTTLTLAGGATLNTLNAAGQIVNLSGAINLGAGSGTTTLGLDIGSLSNYDQFNGTGAATTANAVVLNLTGLGSNAAGNYDLLTATSGLNSATYSVGTFTNRTAGLSYSLSTDPTYVRLAATALTGPMYWGGTVNTSWTGSSGLNTNFASTIGGTNAQGTPGASSNVIFSTNTQSVASLATTLDAAFSIRDLTFNSEVGSGPLTSISIAPGSGGTLTLTPTATTLGIAVDSSAPATIGISAPIVLGGTQTWTNNNTVTSTVLTVSGGVTGTADLSLKNESTTASGITLSTATVNNAGTITNSGAGSGSVLISSVLGANVTEVFQNSATSQLNVGGNSTAYTGGFTINAGVLSAIGDVDALGTTASTINLGATSGSANATLDYGLSGTWRATPINVVAGSSGNLLTIKSSVDTPVVAGAITLANNLNLSLATNSITFSGGITGTGNVDMTGTAVKTMTIQTGALAFTGNLANNFTGAGAGVVTISALANNTGTITNSSAGTGLMTLSGGVGTNVTAITLNSTTSALTVSTAALQVNSGGTTLTNALGTQLLTVSGGVSGTGNLILDNDSATASGITVGTTTANNTGEIRNIGSGSGSVLLSAILGTNVTEVVQNSATSQLNVGGNSTAYVGGFTINAGVLSAITDLDALGTTASTINLGATSGTANATLDYGLTGNWIATPITVVGGSSSNLLTIKSSVDTPVVAGAITLANNLSLSLATNSITFSGGITGTGNVAITGTAAKALTIQTGALAFTGDLTNNYTGTGAGVVTISAGVNNTGKIINNSAGSSTMTVSGIIGSNVTEVIQNSTTSSLTLSGANSFGALTVRAGTVAGTTSASAFGAGTITLGDSAVNAANVRLTGFIGSANVTNPIVLGSGTTGTITIATTNASTPYAYSGGVTGANNVAIAADGSQSLTFSGSAFNNTGSLTNAGTGSGAAIISANVGSNVTNLIQNSVTSAMTLSGADIDYTGATTVSAGTLNITGDATGGTKARTTLAVAGGATLNTLNTVGQVVNLSGAINLGAGAGTTTLGLDIGSLSNYDQFNGSGAATTTNSVLLNLNGIGGIVAGNYDLLTAGSGLNDATYSIGTFTNAGGFSYGLTTDPTYVRLTSTALSGAMYWGGAVNNSWAAFGGGLNTNFATTLAGANAKGTPGVNSNVIFSTSTQTVASLATTLDGAFSIRDLTFNNQVGSGPLTSISIAPGTGGTLTLTPTATTLGIAVDSSAPATIGISAPIILGGTQTWTNNNTATATVLTVSGGVTGTANLILKNESTTAGGITISTGSLNNTGTITNSGAGTGSSIISFAIGSNVTGLVQDSATSALTISGTQIYSAPTTVNNGVLAAGATTGFSANSAYTVNANGILRLNNNANSIGSLSGSGTVENGSTGSAARVLTLGGLNTSTTFSGVLQDGGSFGLSLTKVGTGELTLSGNSSTNTGVMNVNGGRLRVTGTYSQGANLGSTGVGNGASTSGALYVPAGGSYSSATVGIGGNATGVGSLVVTGGGAVAATTTNTQAGFTVGNGGYGGVFLSGATSSITTPRFETASSVAATAVAITQITGGTLTTTGDFILLRNGRFDFTMTGGLVDRIAPGNTIAIGSEGASAYGGAFTIAGGAVENTGASFQFKRTSTGGVVMSGTASLNLNGGTLTTNSITVGSGTASAIANINFNGGTLKASAGGAFIPNTIDNLRIYSGGAIIDSNGNNITIAEPILAPTGSGVTGVTGLFAGSGYIGAPFVEFSGGGGTGATGYAVVDLDTTSGTYGQVTSVVISNPGVGYTGAPTITLVGGLGTGGTPATVTANAPVANVSGGLTKDGGGILTLSGANTYTGGTTINAGTVALGVANALANAGNVTIAGGTFDVATFNDTVATVSLQSGAITGTTGVLTSTANYDLRSGTASAILAGSVGVNKTTAGTVALSGANTYSGVTSITAGTLAFSAANNLGNASVTNTITLNGGTLNYTGAGSINLAANQVMTIGASGGTLNAADAGGTLNLLGGITTAGAANLIKTGLGTVSVTGSTNLNGGNVTVSAGVLNAGFTATGLGAINVANGGTLNLYNGATTTMAISGLILANGSSLGFDLGATSVNDVLNLTAAPTITSTVSLNFNNLGGGMPTMSLGIYDLINTTTGTFAAGNFILGLAPSGFNYNFSTINSDQTLRLTTTPLTLRYWTGDQGGNWDTDIGPGNTNWASDAAGATDLGALPVLTDTLVFSGTNANAPLGVVATSLNNVPVTADSLRFISAPTTPVTTAVTVASGGAGGILTINPISANNGITVAALGGDVIISAPVVAQSNQTWEVVGGSTSSLTVSGDVTFTGSVTKSGAGVLTLSGSNSGAGGLDLTTGSLVIANNNALGTGTFSIGAGTTINTGAGAITNAGNNAQNWNGNFTFTGSNTLDLGSGAVTLADNVIATVSGQTLTVGGAIGDGASTFGLTKAGAGSTLTLSGNNTYGGVTSVTAGTLNLNGNNSGAAGGVTMAATTTLNIGQNATGTTNALGTGTFTINGGTLDNTSGSAITANGGNNAQAWNANFVFTGSSDLNLGAGNVTLGNTTQITTTANKLTIGGVIDDGISTLGLTKTGAGTLSLGGLNTYDGPTVLNQGALIYTADQILASNTNTLTLGAAAGSTSAYSLNLSGASAQFGGAMLVQTSNTTANTITIGAGKTLRVDGSVTIGFNSAAVTTTKLNLTGATGTFKIGDDGAPTNLGFQLGNGSTNTSSNAATLDLSGLGTFYANLGAGTFRVGEPGANGNAGTGGAGSTLILSGNSTIIATTITSDSGTADVNQAIKLGSGTNELNAATITIGGAANRGTGTLDFNGVTGTIKIRALDGLGRAAMNVQNGNATTGSNLFGTVDFTGHSADLLLGTLAVGGRSASAASGNGTGTFSFNTGTLDATTINVGARTGTASVLGSVTGTVTIGGGTSTIGTLTMATNSVALTAGSSTGDATAILNISGGTNSIGTVTMGVNTVAAGFATGSDTDATINITGGATTVNTTFTMGAQTSALNAATTVNTAISALNISAGSLTLAGSTNLTMGQATLDAQNAATSSINITGTGSLTVGGNIQYTNATLGTENNTVTLNGGTLDMTSGNIGGAGGTGAGAGIITFNAQSGTLRNVAQINGGAGLTKTAGAGTNVLILEGTNTYTGNTVINSGTLQLGSGVATGSMAVTSAISVGIGATFAIRQSDTVTQGTDFSNAAITGLGSFAQTGSGTTVLNLSNSYGGGTTVSNGTLLVNNLTGSGTGAGDVLVQTGGTLGGSGIIAGNVTVGGTSGISTLAPGNSIDMLTVGGLTTIDGLGTLDYEVEGATLNSASAISLYNNGNSAPLLAALATWRTSYVDGTTLHDHIRITGSLAPVLNGGVALNLTGLYTPAFGDVFSLMAWDFGGAGAATGTPDFDFDDALLGGGLAWDTTRFLTDGVVFVVPEPSRAMLLLLGLLGLGLRRRREGV